MTNNDQEKREQLVRLETARSVVKQVVKAVPDDRTKLLIIKHLAMELESNCAMVEIVNALDPHIREYALSRFVDENVEQSATNVPGLLHG